MPTHQCPCACAGIYILYIHKHVYTIYVRVDICISRYCKRPARAGVQTYSASISFAAGAPETPGKERLQVIDLAAFTLTSQPLNYKAVAHCTPCRCEFQRSRLIINGPPHDCHIVSSWELVDFQTHRTLSKETVPELS